MQGYLLNKHNFFAILSQNSRNRNDDVKMVSEMSELRLPNLPKLQ